MRARKKPLSIFFALFSLCFFMLAPLTAEAQGFLSAAPEIPLAPGLQENESGMFIFDKPEGRIVSMEAISAEPAAQILDFYAKTLPNLGWTMSSAPSSAPSSASSSAPVPKANMLVFTRESETLNIQVAGGVVFFRLIPLIAATQ